VINSYNKTN